MGEADHDFEVLFRRLFELHFFSLKAHARHYTGSPAIAEDIVQDAFVQLWEIRDHFNFSGPVKSWLFHAVHNRCINHIRHQQVEGKFREAVQLKLREAELFNPDSGDVQNDRLTDEEFENRLKSAIERLPERCREAFLLSRQSGLSNRQIAVEMKISVKAVERNITRALAFFREVFRDLLTILLLISLFR
jgi:RNA polymerase sigma-70 factor, ECF subfamily